MRLQLALDGTLTQALSLLEKVHPYINVIEIGTPLVIRSGMEAVRQVRANYPDLTVLADLKIMDAGDEEASIAFEAGANIVTVLGVAHDATLQGAVTAATRFGGEIMVDMMRVERPDQRAGQLLAIGCHILCLHTAFDVQEQASGGFSQRIEAIRAANPGLRLAVAGGIKASNISEILPHAPEIIVVGGAITRAADPQAAAQELHARIREG